MCVTYPIHYTFSLVLKYYKKKTYETKSIIICKIFNKFLVDKNKLNKFYSIQIFLILKLKAKPKNLHIYLPNENLWLLNCVFISFDKQVINYFIGIIICMVHVGFEIVQNSKRSQELEPKTNSITIRIQPIAPPCINNSYEF